MGLFWSIRHDGDGENYVAGTSTPQAESRTNFEASRQTDDRVDQLLLICSAMWQLLKEKTNLTEDDLINRVAQLDAEDGNADGKLSNRVQKCVKCDRTIAAKHHRCLYCGHQVHIDNLFKTV
jgi:hypothetical protein